MELVLVVRLAQNIGKYTKYVCYPLSGICSRKNVFSQCVCRNLRITIFATANTHITVMVIIEYRAPKVKVIGMGAQRVLCNSETQDKGTEKLNEIDMSESSENSIW